MAKKYLDDNGLLYLWGKIKAAFVGDINYDSSTGYVTKTKNGSTSNVVAIPTGVSPSSTTPAMDGTAAVGTETAFARGDHVHPTDTSRAASSHTHGYITNDGKMSSSGEQIIASGDSLLIADSSGSDVIVRAKGIDFDGSTTTKALTKKGTWESFAGATHSHTTTDITDFPSTMTPSSHTHGYITNDGTLGNTHQATIANGDRLVITDSSASNKINVPSISFDGSTATKALTQKGTWETFNNYTHPTYTANSASAVKVGNDATGHVVLGSALMASDIKYTSGTPSVSVYTAINANETAISNINSSIGSASGICPLDSSGLVDSSYLPSYVDDVIEAYPVSGATELSQGWLSATSGGSALTPEAGKIYVLMTDTTSYSANSQFRWATNTYVKLNDGGVSSITNGEIDTIVAS